MATLDRDKRVLRNSRGPRGAEGAAVTAITTRIRSGRYLQGQRLSEALLSRDLNLSRNTVREALRSVSTSGLVTLEPNKGARVVYLNRRDIIAMLQLREVIEGFTAALSATNINAGTHRDRIGSLTSEIKKLRELPVKKGIGRFHEHNEAFHEAIVETASNPYAAEALRKLHIPSLRPGYFDYMKEEAFRASLQEHHEIALAVLDGDAANAEALMKAHVRKTRQSLVRLSDELFAKIYGT